MTLKQCRTTQADCNARDARDHRAEFVHGFNVQKLKVRGLFAVAPIENAVGEAQLKILQTVIDHRLEPRR